MEEPKHLEAEEDVGVANIGALQMLNTIQVKPRPQVRELLFVEMSLGNGSTRALVDTGASHNFISIEEAKRLRIKADGGGGSIKAVNSTALPIQGTARGVRTSMGAWSGKLDFSVIPLDEHKVILGMDFFDKVRAIPIPFANSLCIMGESQVCTVPMIRGTTHGNKKISALQVVKQSLEDKPPRRRTSKHRKRHHRRGSRNEGIAKSGGIECHDPIVTKAFPHDPIFLAWQSQGHAPKDMWASHASSRTKEVSPKPNFMVWQRKDQGTTYKSMEWSHAMLEGSRRLHTKQTPPGRI